MKMQSVHPDEVLKAILSKGNRQDKEERLRKLHQLCATEYSRFSQGARDLSVANLARIAVSHGLFKSARSIYNVQSADYAALIKAWEAYNGPSESKKAKQLLAPPEKMAFLTKIEDPGIRSLCQMTFIERDKLRAELNMLKACTKVVINMRPVVNEIASSSNRAADNAVLQLTDSERKALVDAIDSSKLERKGWRLGEDGEILDAQEHFVFNPGFATAITKILGEPKPPPAPNKPPRRLK